MIRILALAILTIPTRAAAGVYVELGNRHEIYISNALIVRVVLLLLAALLIAALISAFSAASRNVTTIVDGGSVEYHDEQADLFRALKRQLDAETEYVDSYIRGMRSRAELDELPEIIEHEKSKRPQKGRGANG